MTRPTSTTPHELAPDVVAAVAAKLFPAAPVVDVVPLRGGLEAAVARITLRDEARRERQVVVKRLGSDARREAARYHALAASGVTPAFLGAVDHDESTYLFLERVRPVSSWPWRDSTNTRLVLEQLARVHRFGDEAAHVDDWNYDAELMSSAAETIAVAAESVTSLRELDVRRELRHLRRVAVSLGDMRKQMNVALGTTLIHGDVHSGNVMLRTRAGRAEVVFLDWGRSRIGSPLEDVSSWLLSLRSWEPAAARDHDSLFRAFLAAAGWPTALTPELRDAYWFAAPAMSSRARCATSSSWPVKAAASSAKSPWPRRAQRSASSAALPSDCHARNAPIAEAEQRPRGQRLTHTHAMSYETSRWRQRLHTVIFEADTVAGRTFDVALIICIVSSVAVVMLESVPSIDARWHRQLFAMEMFFTILFTLEYVLRLIAVRRPLAYARSLYGVIDMLAIVPTWLALIVPGAQMFLTVRVLRVLRIFRVLKLIEYLVEAGVITSALRASRRKIFVFLFAVLTLVVIIGSLMYVVEGPANGFSDIPLSMYWAIVTLTTVGYGDISPRTPLGKLLASLVMIIGYAIIAVPTGIVTSELTAARQRGHSRQACPACGSEGHDDDAIHCKFCGTAL